MDINFFFWNIRGSSDLAEDHTRIGKRLTDYIASLPDSEKPHIICLVENLFDEANMKKILPKEYKLVHHSERDKGRGIRKEWIKYISTYATQNGFNLSPATFPWTKHMQLNTLEVCSKKILLGCVHLKAKNDVDYLEQYEIAKSYRNEFEEKEINSKIKFDGAIVMGDFNANPFEKSMTKHDAWHALNIEHEHKSLKKKIYFINPTASLVGSFVYGQNSLKPPGTLFSVPSTTRFNDLHWNMFDGCIYRPSLHEYFSKKDFKIVTDFAGEKLFENDEINEEISDHLPISFKFKFKK